MNYKELNLDQLKAEQAVLLERSQRLENEIEVLSKELGVNPNVEEIDEKIGLLNKSMESTKQKMAAIIDELEGVVKESTEEIKIVDVKVAGESATGELREVEAGKQEDFDDFEE